ncbi:MAG: efflux RND transporter periplasmic adaptor subunit [Acidobacteriota bacterium]
MSLRTTLGTSWRWILQPLLVVAILVLGFLAASRLGGAKKPPARTERPEYAPLVRTLALTVGDHDIELHGNGTLHARSQVDLVSQVGGKVVRVNPELRPGGIFKKGDRLLQVERRDYELAVEKAEADLAAARAQREFEEAEADADVKQWKALRPGQTIPRLVSRGPQLAEAEARVRSARASVEDAKLDLRRTTLTADFDGRVVSSDVEKGEVVMAGGTLAVLYSTETLEVPVPLDLQHAQRLSPGDDGAASVRLDLGDEELLVPARLARFEGRVDQTSRRVNAVVELRSEDLPEDRRASALPGLFVEAVLPAGTLEDVLRVPSSALRADGRLWIVEDDRLRIVDGEIAWQDRDAVYLRGLPERVEVVISSLDVVTDRMAVRSQSVDPRNDGDLS